MNWDSNPSETGWDSNKGCTWVCIPQGHPASPLLSLNKIKSCWSSGPESKCSLTSNARCLMQHPADALVIAYSQSKTLWVVRSPLRCLVCIPSPTGYILPKRNNLSFSWSAINSDKTSQCIPSFEWNRKAACPPSIQVTNIKDPTIHIFKTIGHCVYLPWFEGFPLVWRCWI